MASQNLLPWQHGYVPEVDFASSEGGEGEGEGAGGEGGEGGDPRPATAAEAESIDSQVRLAGAKAKLIKTLNNSSTELRASPIDGIGVFAWRDMPANVNPFPFNGPPSSRTLDLTPTDLSALSAPAKAKVLKFFLRNPDGSYPVPLAGLIAALGTSFYMNSAVAVDDRGRETRGIGNVEIGEELDSSGYTAMRTTRPIREGEELLFSYSISQSGRSTATLVDGAAARLPTAGFMECRVCNEDIPSAHAAGVVDIGCPCVNSVLHKKCATKWFRPRIELTFKQNRPDDVEHDEVVNQWSAAPGCTCEVCNRPVSESFGLELLKACAAGERAAPAVVKLNELVEKGEPVAVQLARVPGMVTVMRNHYETHGGGKGGGQPARVRVGQTEEQVRGRSEGFQSLGRAAKKKKGADTRREVDALAAAGSATREGVVVLGRRKGGLAGKRASFWMHGDRKWAPGKIGRYISSEKRNAGCCADAVCRCCKLGGTYVYVLDGGEDGYESQFSDEDGTVRVDGKCKEELWG